MAITHTGGELMNEAQSTQAVKQDQPKALRALAHLVSYVFHPVLMPTIMTLVLYRLSAASFAGVEPKVFTLAYIIRIGVNSAMFPIISVLLLKAVGFIESIHLRTSKERIIPLIISIIFYWWTNQIFKHEAATPVIIRILLQGSYWAVLAIFLINIFFKISMHTVAAGGVVGLMIVLMILSPISMTVPLFVALFFAGIVGTARMILKAHYPAEIWLGYIVGIAAQVGAYYYIT